MLFAISIMKTKLISLLLAILLISFQGCKNKAKTDLYPIVFRSSIENSFIDSLNPLSVGNGKFIFTTDITGLQTFPEFYSRGIPIGTMSDSDWRNGEKNENSYHIQPGLIGLRILKANGEEISSDDIKYPSQVLNLWTGKIDSRFKIDGIPVHIETVCHPDYDMVSVRVTSGLLRNKRLGIKLSFFKKIPSPSVSNFNASGNHIPQIISDTNNLVIFSGNKDEHDVIVWRNDADIIKVTDYMYYLEPEEADSVYSFSCQFMNSPLAGRVQTFGETEAASSKSWGIFWNTIDTYNFHGSTDPKSRALERDAIISLYLNKIRSSSSRNQRSELP